MSTSRLLRFAQRVRDGEAQSQRDLTAIAAAFENIVLGGLDARQALGIARKRGRPRRTGDKWSANVLAPILEVERLRRKDGMALAVALQKVASERGIAYTTLERYQKKHRRDAEILEG